MATAVLMISLSASSAAAKEKAAAVALGDIDRRPPGEDDELYRCGKATGDIAVSFKPGTELGDLVAWAMSFTCKNFVYSSRVVAGRSLTVTIVAPSAMSPAEAWRLFLVALHGMNLTVVARGKVLEIVELPQARRHALPVLMPGSATPADDQVMRMVFRPARIPVDDLMAALKPLASADGELVPLPRAGLLVVTDTGAHLARMRELAEEVDQGGPESGVFTLPVERARAADLAPLLRELLAGDGPAGKEGAATAEAAPVRVLVDERTNALVLLATRPAYTRVRVLVERLDIDTGTGGGGRAHIVALRHGDAVKMAETLNATLGGAPQPARPAKGEPAAGAIEGQVRVTADALSNSLLVWADTRDFVAVREIVRQLDSARPQVFIEASTHSEERKTNLVVLLTPYVLADPLDRARSVDRVLARRSEVLGALERLDAMQMRPRPDGSRLRGLVAEIDRTVREVEEQKALLDSLDMTPTVPAGPVDSP